jgi:hypothetical protein
LLWAPGQRRYTTGGNDGIADDGGDDFVEAGAGDGCCHRHGH